MYECLYTLCVGVYVCMYSPGNEAMWMDVLVCVCACVCVHVRVLMCLSLYTSCVCTFVLQCLA